MKKSHVYFLFRGTLVSLVLLVLIFTACEKDITEISTAQGEAAVFDDSSGGNFISASDIPEVISQLGENLKRFGVKTDISKRELSGQDFLVNLERIVERKNKNHLPTNYSFALYKVNSPINEFYNLVVGENEDGSIRDPYVIRYVVDDSLLETYIASGGSLENFRGKMYLHSVEEFFGEGEFSLKGSADDCPVNGDGYYIIPPAQPSGSYSPGQSFNTTNTAGSGSSAAMVGYSQVGAAQYTGAYYYNFSLIATTHDASGNLSTQTVTTATSISPAGPVTTNVSGPYGTVITTTGPPMTQYTSSVVYTYNTGTTDVGSGGGFGGCHMTETVWNSQGIVVYHVITPIPCEGNQQKSNLAAKDCIYFQEGEVGVNAETMTLKVNFKLGFSTSSAEYAWMENHLLETYTIYKFILDNGSNNQYIIDFSKYVVEGYTNNVTVVEGPEVPIQDILAYLLCLNTQSGAVLTIYAEQPSSSLPSQDYKLFGAGVGHSFISIQQGSNRVSYGFYPETGVGYPNSNDGIMGNNENHAYDVSVTVNISPQVLEQIITHSLAYAASPYNLKESNCTDFALTVANIAGFGIPKSDCISTHILGRGATPGKFGEYLRNMTLPSGATRNTNGGTSPMNTNCD